MLTETPGAPVVTKHLSNIVGSLLSLLMEHRAETASYQHGIWEMEPKHCIDFGKSKLS